MEPVSAGIFGFLLGLSFWWWLAIIVGIACMFPIVEYEQGPLGLLTIVGVCVIMYFASGVNMAAVIWNNLPLVLAYGAIYICIIGAGWSVFMWRRLGKKCRAEFDRFHQEFIATWRDNLSRPNSSALTELLKNHTDKDETKKAMTEALAANTIPDQLLDQWHDEMRDAALSRRALGLRNDDNRLSFSKPSPLDYKRKITTWIAFWPWSMAWYALHNLIMDLVNAVWRRLVRVYAYFSDKAFEGVDDRLLRKK
jgi:hypothetical protein